MRKTPQPPSLLILSLKIFCEEAFLRDSFWDKCLGPFDFNTNKYTRGEQVTVLYQKLQPFGCSHSHLIAWVKIKLITQKWLKLLIMFFQYVCKKHLMYNFNTFVIQKTTSYIQFLSFTACKIFHGYQHQMISMLT